MKKIKLVICVSLIVVGLAFYLKDITNTRKEKTIIQNKIDYTMAEIVSYKYVEKENTYTSILSIPKIGLKKGIYDINDERNNINDNIMIDKHSVYPNNSLSNVILVAHSGVGDTAYFNRIKELDTDSLIEFYYEHTKYIYKIDNYYYVEKTGSVKLKYDENKKTITLITCSSNNKQVVYIGYLIDEVNY